MKITKYEHACLDISDNGTRIVIDPGKFSVSFKNFSDIAALVITHIHSDHFDIDTVNEIIAKNPNIKILTTEQVKEQITDQSVRAVKEGDSEVINDVELKFFGGNHEFYNEFQNIAVLVGNKLFHPGDSYTVPSVSFDILAAPASAPWLRAKDAADFIVACKPKAAFPIHNSLLSSVGEELHYRILEAACKENSITWKVLEPGQSIET